MKRWEAKWQRRHNCKPTAKSVRSTRCAAKTRTFVVERRGGYPWAEGYFNHNADAPLPLSVRSDTAAKFPCVLPIRFRKDLDKVKAVVLRAVFSGTAADDPFEIRLAGRPLSIASRDPGWKDPQIYVGRGEPPASGGRLSRYKIDPKQRLLKLECAVRLEDCAVGKTPVEIVYGGDKDCVLEKLELDVRYG